MPQTRNPVYEACISCIKTALVGPGSVLFKAGVNLTSHGEETAFSTTSLFLLSIRLFPLRAHRGTALSLPYWPPKDAGLFLLDRLPFLFSMSFVTFHCELLDSKFDLLIFHMLLLGVYLITFLMPHTDDAWCFLFQGTSVLTVSAHDADAGFRRPLSFKILDGNYLVSYVCLLFCYSDMDHQYV